ncbi:MAG: hypothetical protein BWY83_02682 [bacterium ADurb.Bin478]|nr:MAG: hypothetical protein BWY83_02682 [bacterium ADurb.Bin478]
MLPESLDDGAVFFFRIGDRHIDHAGHVLLDQAVGIIFRLEKQIIGVAQNNGMFVARGLVLGAARQFGGTAGADVRHQNADDALLAIVRIPLQNKSAKTSSRFQIGEIDQIADGLPDRGAAQAGDAHQLLFRRDALTGFKDPELDLFNKPILQLIILRNRAVAVNDHVGLTKRVLSVQMYLKNFSIASFFIHPGHFYRPLFACESWTSFLY